MTTLLKVLTWLKPVPGPADCIEREAAEDKAVWKGLVYAGLVILLYILMESL